MNQLLKPWLFIVWGYILAAALTFGGLAVMDRYGLLKDGRCVREWHGYCLLRKVLP